ncbi:hypothetical protein LZ31DRAFT_25053 [Colletotrichum somersetense]|nr:hypothetical protein LZ31DRAFT_25053 [Colletotrichum somersetense]
MIRSMISSIGQVQDARNRIAAAGTPPRPGGDVLSCDAARVRCGRPRPSGAHTPPQPAPPATLGTCHTCETMTDNVCLSVAAVTHPTMPPMLLERSMAWSQTYDDSTWWCPWRWPDRGLGRFSKLVVLYLTPGRSCKGQKAKVSKRTADRPIRQ